MVFPGIGPVEGGWYFTDRPFVPYPNVYNSRNWYEPKDLDFPVGEVSPYPRPYRKGSGPGASVCTGPDASADAWAGRPTSARFLVPGLTAKESSTWLRDRSFRARIGRGGRLILLTRSRTWSARYQWAGRAMPLWSRFRQWRSRIQWAGRYLVDANRFRTWSVETTSIAHYSTSWTRSRTWSARIETEDRFAVTWDRSRTWSAVSRFVPNYETTWTRSRTWSVVSHWTDNVISFNCTTAVAAGSTQGTATTLAGDSVGCTSTGANQGVILPAGCYRILVRNNNSLGGNSIKVYPPSGAAIAANGTNNPITLSTGQSIIFIEISSTYWVQVSVTG